MPERPTLTRLLTALALTVPLLAAAQTSPPPLTAAERAQREADRVFSVIKFHTIRSKPAEAGSKPATARAPSPPAQRPAPQARPAPSAVNAMAPVAEPTEPKPGASLGATEAAVAAPASTQPGLEQAAEPASAAATMGSEPEPDEHEEVPLRMQSFVAPVLTPALQATLGAGERHVRVRLTVEADGTVSEAEAAAGVPRRLARPATDAILQWRFEPLPQARTAEVEIAFRRD